MNSDKMITPLFCYHCNHNDSNYRVKNSIFSIYKLQCIMFIQKAKTVTVK